MRLRTALGAGFLGSAAWGFLEAQAPFQEYPTPEYENSPIPPDGNQTTEWIRARLRYPDIYGYPSKQLAQNGAAGAACGLRSSFLDGGANGAPLCAFVDLRMRDGRPFPGYWTMDYPRSDRHLMAGVRRLTRIDTRSVGQVVSLDGTAELYNWPCLYTVEVGHWRLPDDQAGQLRESCSAAAS